MTDEAGNLKADFSPYATFTDCVVTCSSYTTKSCCESNSNCDWCAQCGGLSGKKVNTWLAGTCVNTGTDCGYHCQVPYCGASCSQNSDCACHADGCAGNDYYDYPAYGSCPNCVGECVCNTGTGAGQPCQPTITKNDPRCVSHVCGDGTVNPPEQCELPNTNNNNYCSQTTSQCSGYKKGTRDSKGNCDSLCGCKYDNFTYSCVQGQCGAQCDSNDDCSDGKPNTIDTCLGNCTCENIPQPSCGDGAVNPPEQCELPNSFNNDYCPQSNASECLGHKLGIRDAFGNCDSECGCSDDPFIYMCVKGQCGATCSGNSDCQNYCSGSFRYFNGVCRTCDTCQCAYSYENCNSRDGWYNDIEYRWVSTGQCTEKEQVKSEYRDYSCAPEACTYVSSQVSWTDTGNMRDKTGSCDDGLFCTEGDRCNDGVCTGSSRDCSQYNFSSIATCFNDPDSNPFTWDFADGFTSVCDEAHDRCTTGEQEIGHECSIELCEAQCEDDSQCNASECKETFADYCTGLNKLVDYNSNKIQDSVEVSDSAENTCLGNCTCTNNPVECDPPQPQIYCVKDVCDAACGQDSDCDLNDSNYIDTCNLEDCSCHHEYVPSCGNGIVDPQINETCELPGTDDNTNCTQSTSECEPGGFKVAFRDQYGDCNGECGCVDDPLEYQCVKGECGAECAIDADCDDKNESTIETCLDNCQCHYEVYVPFCGNGKLDPPEEECELNGTSNNDYCSQTTRDKCMGYKMGVRDAFGNCDSECGCSDDPFIYMCVKGECGATCSGNSDCHNYCSGSFRYYNGVCRTCSTCSCSYSYENCDYKDSWHTTSDYQWVSAGECTEKQQLKNEYRDYYCAPQACAYTATLIVWEDTGQTRDKEDGSSCGISRDCPESYCQGTSLISFPQDGDDSCQAGQCTEHSCSQTVIENSPACMGQGTDTDGDGVPDSQDECVEVYGTACNGCPDPCSGCAKMVCESGPPACEGDNSLCITTCPQDACGTGECTNAMADYPDSVQNTCTVDGDAGICGAENTCQPECKESISCLPRADHVVFSQVLYDAAGSDTEKEWLELYNPTGSDIDLGGLKINDTGGSTAGSWTIPEGIIIKAGGYVTIADNATEFFKIYGCYPVVEGFTRTLDNSNGDGLWLKNAAQVVDMVAWKGNVSGWNLYADAGKVIARYPVWHDTDSPSDWLNNTDPIMAEYEIEVQTDKGAYYPGENMTISGKLVNKHCRFADNQTINYTVIGCCMAGELKTDTDGQFSAVVQVPVDMPQDSYTLQVLYAFGAGQNVSNSTGFSVTADMDGDGYDYSSDCNDNNPSIHPGASDVCGNGVDEDCSGSDSVCPSSSGGSSSSSSFVSLSGGGGGGFSCTTNWSCTDFSECRDGKQSRVCTDLNNCGISSSKPVEEQACSEPGCVAGTRMCKNDYLMECSPQGEWLTIQLCEFGCSDDHCLEGAGSSELDIGPTAAEGAPVGGFFLFEPGAWPYWVAIALIFIGSAWYLFRPKKMKAQVGGWSGYKPKSAHPGKKR